MAANNSAKKNKRENFLKLYSRTCDRVYCYAYECTFNSFDAELISRNAYVYMYQNLSQLRHSTSIDAWQRDCVRQAFRALVRSNRLSMMHEGEAGTTPPPLTEDEKENLWRAINKYGNIDPWRLVPVPGQTSAITVIKDRYISDLSNKSIADIGKIILIGLLSVAAVVGVVVFGINLIADKTSVKVEPMQEIFLEERSYTVSSQQDVQVDYNELEDLVESAEKEASWIEYQSMLESRANMSSVVSAEYVFASSDPLLYIAELVSSRPLVYASAEEIGLTVGAKKLTGDSEIDVAIAEMIEDIDLSGENDIEIIANIYEYVGKHFIYSDEDTSSVSVNDYVKYYILNKKGDSRHYAAVLSTVLNACGYNCEVVSGYFVLNSGTEFEKNVDHYWNRLNLNGIYYYLDLEADCNASGTQVRYNYFMATRNNSLWSIFQRDHVIN